MNYLVATIKSWNIENFYKIKQEDRGNGWFLIDKKDDLTIDKIKAINPRYIFVPHWSWIIPREIWSNFDCVVFHMTDLPYGRGGTPLQNLIFRGHKNTKISAIKVNAGIDTGSIYYKEDLDLSGSAEEIYKRASRIICEKMIPYIVKNNPIPKEQLGEAVDFKRRSSEQSEIPENVNLEKLYDFIRMLDAEGYPKAFLKIKDLKIDFSKAKLKNNKSTAMVEIYEK